MLKRFLGHGVGSGKSGGAVVAQSPLPVAPVVVRLRPGTEQPSTWGGEAVTEGVVAGGRSLGRDAVAGLISCSDGLG